MEQKDCAFGKDILNGEDIKIIKCNSPCKENCPYFIKSLGY